MSFGEAVKSGFDHYVKFDGRASRSAFWWWYLFSVIVFVVAAVIDMSLGTYPLFYLLSALALFLPGLSVSIRRLHDTGRTGWWYLISFIPLIGFIVLLIFFLERSEEGPNDYGSRPDEDEATPAVA